MLTAAVSADSPRPRNRATRSAVPRDLAERNGLVASHMYLVQAAAGRMKRSSGRYLSMDELVAFGTDGLIDAADRFDPDRGASFPTFSFLRIRGAILDGIRSSQWYSRYDIARFHASNGAAAEQPDAAVGNLGADPSGGGTTVPARAASRAVPGTFSHAPVRMLPLEYLQVQGEEEHGDSVEFSLPADHQTLAPDEAHALGELSDRLRRAVAKLPARERAVIEGHYFADRDLQEVGAGLGVRKWTTSRLHARAVRMLRDTLLADGVGKGGADAPV